LINFENVRSRWPHHRGDIVVFNEQLHAVAGDSPDAFLEYYENTWESKGNIFDDLKDFNDFPIGSLSDFSSLVVQGKYEKSSDILYLYYGNMILSYDGDTGWTTESYRMGEGWVRNNHRTNLFDRNLIIYGGDTLYTDDLTVRSEFFSFEVGYSITDNGHTVQNRTKVEIMLPRESLAIPLISNDENDLLETYVWEEYTKGTHYQI